MLQCSEFIIYEKRRRCTMPQEADLVNLVKIIKNNLDEYDRYRGYGGILFSGKASERIIKLKKYRA